MEKICFKSEERTAKERVLVPFPANCFFFKNWSQNHIYTLEFLKILFSSVDSPNPQLYAIRLNYYGIA